MSSRSITIRVDEQAARAFSAATDADRRKMELLLAFRLEDLTAAPQKSLKQIMDELSAQARSRGMTPEILESLLNDH